MLWNRSWLPVKEIPSRKRHWKQKPFLPNPQGGAACVPALLHFILVGTEVILASGRMSRLHAPALPSHSPSHGWQGPCLRGPNTTQGEERVCLQKQRFPFCNLFMNSTNFREKVGEVFSSILGDTTGMKGAGSKGQQGERSASANTGNLQTLKQLQQGQQLQKFLFEA